MIAEKEKAGATTPARKRLTTQQRISQTHSPVKPENSDRRNFIVFACGKRTAGRLAGI